MEETVGYLEMMRLGRVGKWAVIVWRYQAGAELKVRATWRDNILSLRALGLSQREDSMTYMKGTLMG